LARPVVLSVQWWLTVRLISNAACTQHSDVNHAVVLSQLHYAALITLVPVLREIIIESVDFIDVSFY